MGRRSDTENKRFTPPPPPPLVCVLLVEGRGEKGEGTRRE